MSKQENDEEDNEDEEVHEDVDVMHQLEEEFPVGDKCGVVGWCGWVV